MKMIKAFCSYSSVLSTKEYLQILNKYYKYNSNVLLSLYDINYYLRNEKTMLQDIFVRANSVFLDSGVYEIETCMKQGLAHAKWNNQLYLDTLNWVLSEFTINKDVYITNYDKYNLGLEEQLSTSICAFEKIDSQFDLNNARYVFAIHTDPLNAENHVISNIRALLSDFRNSAILAIPEKELGANLYDKINGLKLLISQEYPLHILGCLDPTYIIIFAFIGVRNFDGLNWLKFYFNNKLSYYRNIYDLDLIKGNVVDPRSYIINNCIYIDKLINDIEYSIATEDYSMFDEECSILSELAK